VLTANSVQYLLPCFCSGYQSRYGADFCVLTQCNTGTSFYVLFSVYPVLTQSRHLVLPVLQCNTGFPCTGTCSAHRSRYRSIPVLAFLFFFQFIPVLTQSRHLALLQCNTGFSCTGSAHRSRYRSDINESRAGAARRRYLFRLPVPVPIQSRHSALTQDPGAGAARHTQATSIPVA
jgi:hypothetical protein